VIGTAFHPVIYYFPHDDFYDTSTRDVIAEIAANNTHGITVACETPVLFEYYAGKANRPDLHFVSLSDKTEVQKLKTDDVVVYTAGRRYVSNKEYLERLAATGASSKDIKIGDLTSSQIYVLDESSAEAMREIGSR
jgi:hypothetical protein